MPESKRYVFWQQQVADQAERGLSAAAFCRERSLVYHQFIYWRQQFSTCDSPPAKAVTGFARVTRREQADIVTDTGVSILLPNGVQITGLHAGNVALLGQVIAQL